MNLKKLFKMQDALDEHIMDEHPELKGQDNLDWKILALQVELGECANEWRGFKKWSKDQKPRKIVEVFCKECQGTGTPIGIPEESGVDCWRCEGAGSYFKNPLLEEYVDCLHFILSIGLEFGYNNKPSLTIVPDNTIDQFNDLFKIISYMYNTYTDYSGYGCGVHDFYDDLLGNFMNLGHLLGFSWDQIEQAYLDKNEINHQRQESGY